MNNLTGAVLVQRFRIDALERQDYLGDDYRSWDLKRNLPLLIKVLRADLPPDPTLLSFQQGALTLQSLNHPHIIPFYGLYQDGRISFLVERYIDGSPLRQRLLEQSTRAISPDDSIIYLKALCLALAYAQGFGLVHCNVNPSNIWLARDGNILLGGFGLSRSVESLMTPTGVAGPPVYMAPEMLLRREITPATDIYGLGLVMFELLTGQHPFLGVLPPTVPPTEAERLGDAHLNQPPPHPRSIMPEIPHGLAQVVLTALAKEPRDRYQSPQEMLEIACALMNRSTESVPEHFGAADGMEATLVMQKSPLETQISAPPPIPRTAVAPVISLAASQIPATQVVPTPEGYPAARPPVVIPPTPRSRPTGRPGWIIAAGIGLVLVACLLLIGAGAFALSSGLLPLGGEASPTASATSTPTQTPAEPTLAPIVATEISASPTFTVPPAQPTAIPPTATLQPSPTLLPTDTIAPTATLVPTSPPPATSFTVTIRNNLGYPAYAFRDNRLMGTDPIPPRTYIYYLNVPAGRHVFTVCEMQNMTLCEPTRTVDITQDTTIAFP